MRRTFFLALGLAALASLAGAQGKADKSLTVKLSYTGSGSVDDKHKIFIFLFDSPDFVQGGVMPIRSQVATEKEQKVTFTELTQDTVYAVAIYDPKGEYEGMSGPPQGASTGLYSNSPGVPAPVKLEGGKPVEIALTFDDSVKMP